MTQPDMETGGTVCMKEYTYALYSTDSGSDNSSARPGTVVAYVEGAYGEVNADLSRTGAVNAIAGVLPHTATVDYYGWIQSGGYCSAVRTDGNAVNGSILAATASDAGIAGVYDNTGTDALAVLGYALVTDADSGDAGTSCPAMLQIR